MSQRTAVSSLDGTVWEIGHNQRRLLTFIEGLSKVVASPDTEDERKRAIFRLRNAADGIEASAQLLREAARKLETQ